jgi:hypothetical protein
MMWFLLMVLLSALILFAMISANPKSRGHQRRGHTGGWGHNRSGGGSSSHRPSTPPMNREQIATRWITIQGMAATDGNGLRQAVSEADKLFDQALRQSGVSGDTMGERLKSAKSRFPNHSTYDGIWRAHKLRNALAHEVGFDLVASQAKEALRDFERGLKDLGVL